MSGETTLKFIIPSLCQQDFTVSAYFDDRPPENVLLCDWVEKYDCNNAPGYTYTIGNHSALLTVPRDLKETPQAFICELFGQPKTDRIKCVCVQAAVIPVQPDSDSPGQVDVIVGLITGVVLLYVILFVVGILTYIRYRRRTSPKSKQKQMKYRADRPSSEPRMDVPQISATDSLEFSTPLLAVPSTATVPPKKETIIQLSHPEPDNTSRMTRIPL